MLEWIKVAISEGTYCLLLEIQLQSYVAWAVLLSAYI